MRMKDGNIDDEREDYVMMLTITTDHLNALR